MKERPQHPNRLVRQLRLVQRAVHQRHPSVPGRFVQPERRVAHPQPGMATLLHVSRRPAKAPNQEQAQPLFGTGKVFGRIHRPENVVARDLRVERADQPPESLLANQRVHISIVHASII